LAALELGDYRRRRSANGTAPDKPCRGGDTSPFTLNGIPAAPRMGSTFAGPTRILKWSIRYPGFSLDSGSGANVSPEYWYLRPWSHTDRPQV
jgi:hypothetical protein